MSDWHGRLANGLAELGIDADPATLDKLITFVGLLQKWNRAYSLTSIREPARMVTHHLLDSAAIFPHLRGDSVLDVGTGAGLPGLVLAALAPALPVTLLDATGKKTTFCEHAAERMGLKNVVVVNARIEDYRPQRPFDTVVARAFSALAELALLAGPATAPGGRLLAMKGTDPVAETRTLLPGWRLEAIAPLRVPGLGAERHVVILERTGTD